MEIQKNISLRPFNTFGIDVQAAELAICQNEEDLKEAITHGRKKKLPLLVLGGGSNVLLMTHWLGLVILNRIPGIKLVEETTDNVVLNSGAGVIWHHLVEYCIGKGWGGLENLSLIPGCVGASPMQNIGAYGVEIKDHFVSLSAIDLETLETLHFNNTDCAFGYRESIFKHALKNKVVITHCSFRLSKKPKLNISYGAIGQELEKAGIDSPTIGDVSQAVIRIRQSKLPDPASIGNAGSFFKNPVVSPALAEDIRSRYPDLISYPAEEGKIKLAAGWLIEKAGWKGFRTGDAGVHEKQALVIVNYGKANGSDLYQLSENIKRDIFDKFGVSLETEVNLIKF